MGVGRAQRSTHSTRIRDRLTDVGSTFSSSLVEDWVKKVVLCLNELKECFYKFAHDILNSICPEQSGRERERERKRMCHRKTRRDYRQEGKK